MMRRISLLRASKTFRKSLYLSRHACWHDSSGRPFLREFKTQVKRTIPLSEELILSRNKGPRFRSHQRFNFLLPSTRNIFIFYRFCKQHSCTSQNNAVLSKQSLFVSFRELFASFPRISFSLPVGLFFNLTRCDWFKTDRFLRIRPAPFKE